MSRKDMRSVAAAVLGIVMMMLSVTVFADSTADHGESIDAVLSEIRSELNLDAREAIDPEKVSDASLEKLGEAVMSLRIPDPEQHEWMDEMMGGEGSERLADLHRVLGYRYLATGGTGFGPLMMGRGVSGISPGGSFMTGGFTGSSWMILIMMLAVLLVIAAVVLYLLIRNGRKDDPFADDPLLLLKEKYVRGEIGREEYLEKKKDLVGE